MSRKKFEYHYSNGRIKEETYVKDGERNGESIEYYNSDIYKQIKSRGSYIDNLKNGYWEYLRPNGELESTGYYDKGFLNGIWKFYDEEGIMFSEVNYNDDVKNGLFIEYYPNKQVFKEGQFKNDLENGIFYTYYQYDKIFKKFSPNNIVDNIFEIILYENGKIEGIKVFDEKGKLITKEGKDPEYIIEYDYEGNKFAEGKMIKGLKEGIWIYHIPELKAIEYLNDEGIREIFYDGEKIRKVIEYKNDSIIEKEYDEEERIIKKMKDGEKTTYFYNYVIFLYDENGDKFDIQFDKFKRNIKSFDSEYIVKEIGIINGMNIYRSKREVYSDEGKIGVWSYEIDDKRIRIDYKNGKPEVLNSKVKNGNGWEIYGNIAYDEEGKKKHSILENQGEYDTLRIYYDRTPNRKIGVIDNIDKETYLGDKLEYDLTDGKKILLTDESKYLSNGQRISKIFTRKNEEQDFFLYSLFVSDGENGYIWRIDNYEGEDGRMINSFHKMIVKDPDQNQETIYEESYRNDKLYIEIYPDGEEKYFILEGIAVKNYDKIDPEWQDFEEFNEENQWEWFQDSYIMKMKPKENGKYKKYEVNCSGKRLLKQGSYKNYKKDGQWITYDNNKITSIGNYENGLKSGHWEFYSYPNEGTTEEYGEYVDDVKNGLWIEKQGEVISETMYSMGIPEETVFYSNIDPPPYEEEEPPYYILPQIGRPEFE